MDCHKRFVGILLHRLGFSHVSARPLHPAPDAHVRRGIEGTSLRPSTRTKVELWFQGEARIGQKNGIVRQWARRGTRLCQPADQRYKSAYLFGAICPALGIGAALALPFADTEASRLK